MGGFLSPKKPVGAVRAPRRVLTAAGQKLDLTAARGTQKARTPEGWQADAWAYRDSIGEIRFAMQYLAHAVSRVRLVGAVAMPNGDAPVALEDAIQDPDLSSEVTQATVDAVQDMLSRLTSGTFNYSRILGPYAENLEVAGEGWLVGYQTDPADPDSEVWEFRSLDEITVGDRGYRLVDQAGQRDGRELDPETSYVARMWQPHPKWRNLPDSPMRALLGPCEELQLTARMLRSSIRSRFASAGILLMPDSISFDGSTSPTTVATDPDLPSDADPFYEAFTQAITASIADEGDAAAAVPILVKANAEAIAAAKHLTFDRPIDPALLERQEKALTRIAQGLDIPPEIITGMADSNHWSAWQVDDATVRQHVGGLMERMCDGLTAGYLRPMMDEGGYGIPADVAKRIVVWFDLSPLAARPDRAQDAKDAFDRGALSERSLLEALHFDPDADMPDDDERARRLALQRGAVDAGTTVALLDALLRGIALPAPTVQGEVVAPTPEVEAPAEEDAPSTPQPTTGIRAAGTPQARLYGRESKRLARLDRDLRERLSGAADAAVSRAVEKANARIRSTAQKDPALRASLTASTLPPARTLGPSLVADLGLDQEALLSGAFATLSSQWDEWTAAARGEALAGVAAMLGLTEAQTASLAAQLAEASTGAWTWLQAAVEAETMSALYEEDEPDKPVTEEIGEDPTRAGTLSTLIRGALVLAGGVASNSGGIRSNGTNAQPGERTGGIATGHYVTTYLADRGVEDLGYEWVYGISRNHFKPHRDLDGVQFHDFDSSQLRNPGSWPGPTLAPGDHKGCNCDAMPLFGDAPDAAAAEDADSDYVSYLRKMAEDDLASGRTDTTVIRTLMEAERIANRRPSQAQQATPITDAVRGRR